MGYSLVISIVPRESGEIITGAANSAGAAGGTIVLGRGTASNGIIQLLGFGDTSKDIAYSLVPNEIKEKVLGAICDATAEKKAHFGIAYTVDVSRLMKVGNISGGNETMAEKNATHQMITVIVNKGYAEDAMAAARKAGAGGGTIIGARGTAKPGDATFFGMEIVPEKDMLIILVENDKANGVIESIRTLPCLSQPGSGIAFCSDAHDFTFLGKKA